MTEEEFQAFLDIPLIPPTPKWITVFSIAGIIGGLICLAWVIAQIIEIPA